MKSVLALLLVSCCVTSHAHDFAPVDNPRLMRALETLEKHAHPEADGQRVARGARLVAETFLGTAGLALVVTYATHQLPLDVVRRALVKNIRWGAIGGASALVVSGTAWFGAQFFNVVMRDVYAQRARDDRELYQTKKGLTYFFQLPIEEQFLYARQHPEFSEFLVSLADARELLSEGFENPQRPATPKPR